MDEERRWRRSLWRRSTRCASRSTPATTAPIEEAKKLLAADERFTEDDAEHALEVLQN